tara:strand:- start:4422 stop:4748 length:327 start_codon:yes stop_codon:yes gene_type:complete
MKIYNKIVIQDGKVIEEDSYEYEGPVALCMGRRPSPPPPPPPPAPAPPPPKPEPEEDDVITAMDIDQVEGKEGVERVRRRRRAGRGATETGVLGISDAYTGTRRNLLG